MTEEDMKRKVMKAWLRTSDKKNMTSQDICDDLRPTLSMSPDEVTEIMLENGAQLQRVDDQLVWNWNPAIVAIRKGGEG